MSEYGKNKKVAHEISLACSSSQLLKQSKIANSATELFTIVLFFTN